MAVNVWDDVREVLPHVSRCLLYGPPGTGKTTLGFSEDREVFYVSLHEESSVSELLGHFVPVGQRFVWLDGPVLMAWSRGARLILDEIDQASGSVLSVLRAVLNDPSIAQLMLPDPNLAGLDDDSLTALIADGEGQRIIRPVDGFQVLATMNGEPEDLDEPLRDRFEATFRIGEPHPEAIAALPEDLRVAAAASAKLDDEDRRVGLRKWKAFASLRENVSEAVAARAVFGARAGDMQDALKLARGSVKAGQPKPTAGAERAAALAAERAEDREIILESAPIPTVYPIKTGKPGKPPLAVCPSHGKLTHRTGIVSPSGDLHCKRCDLIVATAGNYRVRQLVDGKWVTSEAPSWTERSQKVTPF